MTGVPPLPGDDLSQGVAINDAGLMAVHSAKFSTFASRAFLWDGQNARVLILPNDTDSQVFALNNRGEAVGNSYPISYQNMFPARAFLYSSGRIYALDDLVDLRPGWTIYRVMDINDRGEIIAAAFSVSQDEQQNILLVPKSKSVTPKITKRDLHRAFYERFHNPTGIPPKRSPLSPIR